MFLLSLALKDFRNYGKSQFEFEKNTTVIVGPNTAGKTNFTEAISMLSIGKSPRADKDEELIRFGQTSARITGEIASSLDDKDSTELQIILAKQENERIAKKFLINKVAKRRVDFAGNLLCVLFSPEDLDIIIGGPSLRRRLLNEILEQTDKDYRNAFSVYEKALRQRNALLYNARETGQRNEKQFEYWDKLIIENGGVVTAKRAELIESINNFSKDIFDFVAFYDKSTITAERLLKYKDAELASGITLVGPHRDDIGFSMLSGNSTRDIKSFGSRGQQRLTILQLKLIELSFVEEKMGVRPILVLDDIFSELDTGHIEMVLEMFVKQPARLASQPARQAEHGGQGESVAGRQTFITTTHKEFIDQKFIKDFEVIELNKQ